LSTAIYKASCARPGYAVIDTRALTLTAERQSARASKITNGILTQFGTRCFMVPIW